MRRNSPRLSTTPIRRVATRTTRRRAAGSTKCSATCGGAGRGGVERSAAPARGGKDSCAGERSGRGDRALLPPMQRTPRCHRPACWDNYLGTTLHPDIVSGVPTRFSPHVQTHRHHKGPLTRRTLREKDGPRLRPTSHHITPHSHATQPRRPLTPQPHFPSPQPPPPPGSPVWPRRHPEPCRAALPPSRLGGGEQQGVQPQFPSSAPSSRRYCPSLGSPPESPPIILQAIGWF